MKRLLPWIPGLLFVFLITQCGGCATIPEERHGQELAVVGVAALTVGGILLAKSLAHTNRVQVQPRTTLGPP